MSDHLTHGWEQDLPAEDSLLRRFVLANADRAAAMAALAGGRSHRTDTIALADPASPVFFDNAAVLLQPPEYIDLQAAMSAMIDFYPADRHFVLLSAFPTPDLTSYGLELMGHPPFMFRPAGGTAPPVPTGLAVREVGDATTLVHFVTTLIDGYPMPGAEGATLADPRVLGDDIRLFVGYVDEQAVATAGARIGHGVNDVEWVATASAHRRRGYGAALTWAATLAEPSLPAVLIASDDGQPVYEAMGYVRLQRLTMWHRPAGL
jgi:hypothetical protein